MKLHRLFPVIMAIIMLFAMTPTAFAGTSASGGDNITIICTNDVHCAYTQYERLATAAKDADLLVDAGDAIQGGLIASLSKGEDIVAIMNRLGYDISAIGNHEFDYTVPQLQKLAGAADFPYVSCNFIDCKTGKTVFEPYKIFDVKGKKIAFVGITTPKTFVASTPTHFRDAAGNQIYSFCEDASGKELFKAVQKAVDSAKAEKADFVIALAHLGDGNDCIPWRSADVIKNTSGIDFLIDGHSHKEYVKTVTDKSGKGVQIIQTGTKLESIGKIELSKDGAFSAEVIPAANYATDPDFSKYLAGFTAKLDNLKSKIVAKTDVDLYMQDSDGNNLVRRQETNLGDLCADAYRNAMNADIALINGGSIRSNLPKGDISYMDIMNVLPFGNYICLVEVTGQQIKDAIELGASVLPDTYGGFLQVSGVTYTIDTTVPTHVVTNEKKEFVTAGHEYRVHDILIGGEPLDPNRKYTVAGGDYLLKSGGDGYSMFGPNNVRLVIEGVLTDSEVLVSYITEKLGGTVGEKYSEPQRRITILGDAAVSTVPEPVTKAQSASAAAGSDSAAGANPAAGQAAGRTSDQASSAAAASGSLTYFVVKGDSLSKIAKTKYGSASKWPLIYEANKQLIKDPNKIYIGMQLKIPAA